MFKVIIIDCYPIFRLIDNTCGQLTCPYSLGKEIEIRYWGNDFLFAQSFISWGVIFKK